MTSKLCHKFADPKEAESFYINHDPESVQPLPVSSSSSTSSMLSDNFDPSKHSSGSPNQLSYVKQTCKLNTIIMTQ